jgi:enamine deaminase RidA (YjgF/YER057c/UK114 family)
MQSGFRMMMGQMGMTGLIALATAAPALAQAAAPPAASGQPPAAVTFYGNPNSPISGGVVIPPGAAWVWTSGVGPSVVNKEAKPDDPARWGDTKTQAIGILKNIENQLKAQGLTMRDVVYMRCYLVPDPAKGNKLDVDGWNEAYRQFFGTAENPTKVARATVGVAALVVQNWLVEIEAFAVFPTKK